MLANRNESWKNFDEHKLQCWENEGGSLGPNIKREPESARRQRAGERRECDKTDVIRSKSRSRRDEGQRCVI